MTNDNLIKLHITFDDEGDGLRGEWLWARKISEGRAKLSNIPFTLEFGKDDLVAFDDEMEITDILEKATNTYHARYEAPESKVKQSYIEIVDYLWEYDIHAEGFIGPANGNPGILGMCVPIDLDSNVLDGIMVGCPHPITIMSGGDYGDTGEQEGNDSSPS
jgi:hypothetical protein